MWVWDVGMGCLVNVWKDEKDQIDTYKITNEEVRSVELE
jgi:hypothetical protein